MISRQKVLFAALLHVIACLAILPSEVWAQNGGELRFCLHAEPKTFDPLKVEDDASLSIRYLTGGVLIRVNRQSQALEPELAQSWKVSKDGRQITFKLRSGISFSDGTPFTAEDLLPYRDAVPPADQLDAMQRHKLMRQARSQKNALYCSQS